MGGDASGDWDRVIREQAIAQRAEDRSSELLDALKAVTSGMDRTAYSVTARVHVCAWCRASQGNDTHFDYCPLLKAQQLVTQIEGTK